MSERQFSAFSTFFCVANKILEQHVGAALALDSIFAKHNVRSILGVGSHEFVDMP